MHKGKLYYQMKKVDSSSDGRSDISKERHGIDETKGKQYIHLEKGGRHETFN